MPTNFPLMTVLIAGVIGAAYMALAFRQVQRRPVMGALLGAAAGAVGSLIFVAPLNFCPFYMENNSGEPVARTALDIIFGLGLVVIGMLVTLLPLRWLSSHRSLSGLVSGQATQGAFKGTLMPFLLLAPTLIILLLFLYYPFLDTFRLSTLLTGRTALATGRSRFVCLDNFTGLFSDPQYHYSIIITFVIAAAIILIGLSVSLLIAYMAYQPIKGASIYRTLLVWPYAISPVVAGILFGMMFDPLSGLTNHISGSLFGIEIPWKSSQFWAVIAVILTSVWRVMSFNILFYIAGLQNIPGDLIEASSIDGANVVQRFFRITVPLLSPITFFLVITNMTYAFFDIFGTIDYLTGGGPLKATNVMIYNIYDLQGQTIGLGNAAAQSIVLFFMVIALTLIQFRSTGRRVTYGA